MQYLTVKQKRILILILAVIVVGIVVWLLYYFLTTGQINVTTNDQKNAVLITRLGDADNLKAQPLDMADLKSQPSSYINDSTGNTSVRVADGVYLVRASDNSGNSTAKIITIHPMQTQSINLPIRSPTSVEPVSDRAATSLVATASSLSYVDLTNNNLYRVGADSNETLIDSDHSFQSVQWADATYGIGRGADNNLYVIDGNVITPLSTPFVHADFSRVSYLVLPDRTIYIADGTTLTKILPDGSYKKVFATEKGHTISLYAGDNNGDVLLNETSGSQKTDESELIAVSHTGATTEKEGEVYTSSWSPNGAYIALSGDEVNAIVNPKLQKVADLPSGNVNSPIWLNNTTLLYSISNQLWQYDVSTGSSQIIANVSGDDSITGIVPDQNKDYVYFLDQQGNGNYRLMRVGLHGQKISSTAVRLSIYLPNTTDGCVLDYINFTSLAVIAHGAEGDDADCTTAAQQYLSLYNVSLTGLSIFFSSNS